MNTENNSPQKLGLSFCIRRGRLLIHQSIIRRIGDPEYIRFLYNARDKHIAVQACEAIDQHSYRVPSFAPGDSSSFEINSMPLLSVIYKRCHWDQEKSYLVYGKAFAKNRLVDCDLSTALVITQNLFVEPQIRG